MIYLQVPPAPFSDSHLIFGSLALLVLALLLIFYFAFIISKNAKQIKIQRLIFYRKVYLILLEIFCILVVLSISYFFILLLVVYLLWIRWKIPWFKPIYDYKVIDEIDSFILYLRSFKDDRTNRFSLNEKKIVKLFNRIFSVYAVGCPTELLPAAGAKRIYIADDWKNQVEKLIHKAKFILLKISNTEHFLWESRLCIQNFGSDKLIFFCTADTKAAYKSFQIFLKNSFNIDIPSYDTSKTNNFFIYFKNGIAVLQDFGFNKNNNVKSIAMRFLDDHEEINEENEMLLKRNKGLFLKLFSLKKDKTIDKDLQKWNWGSFFVTWRIPNNYHLGTWLLFYLIEVLTIISANINTWFLTLVLVIAFFWGYNGSKISYLSKRWDGKKYFQRNMKKWNIAGIIVLIIVILNTAMRY
ncbi:MAG: hypothetical protein FWF09_00075 [Bacteroidales bacterium]|nr:hypothetical protein [Bacteroidales bacterium]